MIVVAISASNCWYCLLTPFFKGNLSVLTSSLFFARSENYLGKLLEYRKFIFPSLLGKTFLSPEYKYYSPGEI